MHAKRRWLVAVVVTAAAVLALGLVNSHQKKARQEAALSRVKLQLATYDAFWAQIDANYFDPKFLETPECKKWRAEGRVQAAAAAYYFELYWNVFHDIVQKFPHSHIEANPKASPEQSLEASKLPFSPERFKVLEGYLLGGVGFDAPMVRRQNGIEWVVGDVFVGTPAEKAGIEPGWKVITDSSTLVPADDAVHFNGEFIPPIAGAQPIKIKFDVEQHVSPGERLVSRQLSGGITYLMIGLFDVPEFTNKVLAAIDAAGPAGLIVDLRRNSGGYTDEMMRVAARLLGDGAYIGTERGRAMPHDLRTAIGGPHYSGPLAVLIGPVSASGAEILAAAIQDNRRGILLGRASNGSVLSAKYFPLPDGGTVMVPIEDFVRSGGRRIEASGVEPDIVVVPTLADVRAGRDPVIERAQLELTRVPPAR